MITEIGILIALYIIVRLIPGKYKTLSVIFSIIVLVVALFVIIDLGVRGFSGKNLISNFKSREAPQIVQDMSSSNITRADGGSITTELGYGIAVAKNSSLRREWIFVHDKRLPVDVEGTPGITTVYKSEKYSGSYRYHTKLKLKLSEPVSAVEIKFLTFDIWGNHVRTLMFSEVSDFLKGDFKEFTGQWPLYSENDVEKHYASIGYISRVRLKSGKVLVANTKPVIAEAQKFSSKFTDADLEPKIEKGKGEGK